MYRDQAERCPRCHADLIDARSARACQRCSGMWIAQSILEEMMVEMRTPPRHIDLPLLAHASRPALPCPTCNEPMEMWTLHDVDIDRCLPHGVWFDRDELEGVLRAAAAPLPPDPAAPKLDLRPAAGDSQFSTIGAVIDLIAALFDIF